MFNYINENFLHAPSIDLSRDTVKTLISITLAQAQEVFLEKQIADGKKVGLLAKLASQAATLYAQAVEGVTENVNKSIFDRIWLMVVQIKTSHFSSLAQYYQALADIDANSHGTAIARLQIAEREGKDAVRVANAFPNSLSPSANLSNDTGSILVDMVKRQAAIVQERLSSAIKDNDYIYHDSVPAEASLGTVSKLPAAKAIPVGELYQGQDIQRIIGPDIFTKIVPIAVTQSASLYDEEKAKLLRAESEKVEQANDEMAASLDYLKLPDSLKIIKGGQEPEITVDDEFRSWCTEVAIHEPFDHTFEHLRGDKIIITQILDSCAKNLDLEENVCEKMRVKYGPDWPQPPSGRLNSTLRTEIGNYREAVDLASGSDSQLIFTAKQYGPDFEEMRSAGETDEADILYQRALIHADGSKKGKGAASAHEKSLLDEDFSDSGPSVSEQISKVEEILKKLNLVKKDRIQVLKDLKEKVRFLTCAVIHADTFKKVHNDDISNVLILNKKQISNHEHKLFEDELEKFRSHQNRLLQANHKQQSLLKELTRTYSDLLQDKRVRAEQSKYDSANRSRNTVVSRYRKIYTAFTDLLQGLSRAGAFYTDMKGTVQNYEKNVETFVANRREEGAQFLSQIERRRQSANSESANRDQDRLRDMMERMNVGGGPAPGPQRSIISPPHRTKSVSRPQPSAALSSTSITSAIRPSPSPQPNPYYANPNPGYPPQHTSPLPPQQQQQVGYSHTQTIYAPTGPPPGSTPYGHYPPTGAPSPYQDPYAHSRSTPQPYPHPHAVYAGYPPTHQINTPIPHGYVPPPPPPGPPPPSGNSPYPYGMIPGYAPAAGSGQQPHAQQPPPGQQPQRQGGFGADPWAGALAGWK